MFSTRVSKKKVKSVKSSAVNGKKGRGGGSSWVQRKPFDESKPYYWNTSPLALSPEERISFETPDELKTEEERHKTSGEWVWVPHPSDVWQPAKVVKRGNDGSIQVQPYKGATFTVPASGVMEGARETGGRRQEVPSWDVNFTAMKFLEDDVIQLDGIHEAMILHNVRARYDKDMPFTWVGAGRQVLLSLNPYKDIEAVFNESEMKFHKSQEDKPDKFVPPHVYAIANEAYDALINHDSDQSILISGESGAGKTESTKHCLNFFASQVGSDETDHAVSQKLLLANPLLEAFGNAVTIRNNNSSRFGKWIEVTFSRDSGKIAGAKFSNFMLEKTRVIHHQERERSYHIFYQVLQDSEMKSKFGLESVKTYKYLSQSKMSTKEGNSELQDKQKFAKVLEALQNLEFTAEEQNSIFTILAGVLNLGNIEFEDKEQSSGVTGSVVASGTESWLSKAASSLGLEKDNLREALTTRTIAARGETTAVTLDGSAAKDATDALAKAIYGKLFNFLVHNLNEAMQPKQESFYIGILDIFGFEVLEANSFEQLCINYANEKLQQYFNANTFTLEEAFYKSQGVEYSFLKFVDNQPVLDLLESKPNGILLVLDDEGALPKGSDKGWLGKVEKQYESNELFETDFRRKFESELSFEIKHYADTVKYDAGGFVQKNKDTLFDSSYAVMTSTSDAVLRRLFPQREARINATKPVAAQFRGHVNDLLKLIKSTEVRFVRCIKPNDSMLPDKFEAPLVIKQLKYSGVLETIDIRKGGYPFRLTHKAFSFRFSGINIGHKYRAGNDWEARCQEILDTFDRADLKKNAIVGKTMVLYRADVAKPMELARNLGIEITLPGVQAFIRGSIARHYMNQLGEAQGTLQAALDKANDIALVRKGFDQVHATKEWLEPNLRFLPEYPMHLYNKGKHLESRLMAWEALEDLMHKASDGKRPDDVDVKLYQLLIEYCRQADEDLKDVKRTAAQQELYEFLKELITDSPPGKLDAMAGPALQSLDRQRMQAAKDEADRIGYHTPVVEKIAYILERLEYLDVECKEALEVLDSVRMKEALDECHLYLHTNEDVQEIERLFALPEIEFVKMELEIAKKLGDKPRELHRRIRLRELQIEARWDELKDYKKSGHLRSASSYAKGAMCGRTGLMESFTEWTDKGIPSSLTFVPGEAVGKEDTKEVKQLKKLAKAQFTNVQKYMGDKKAGNPDKFAQKVIDFGINYPGMRNEIYFQLIKQLTNNPNPESVERGYHLLGLVCASYLPSNLFHEYLVVWLRQNPPPDGNWRQYTSAIHQLEFREEDIADGASTKVQDLDKELKKLKEEGSRFSIAIDAFTGPTDADRQRELDKILANKQKGANPAE